MGVFAEHYEILQPLDDGGSASVDVVRDLRDGQIGALKRLHPRMALDPNYRELFEREGEILAALDEVAGVPRLLDAGRHLGAPYLVTDLVDGIELDCYDHRHLSVARCSELLAGVCSIVAAIHDAGFVHRDLTPCNAMIDVRDRMWLIDFGTASPVGGSSRSDELGIVYGTMPYVAPERLHTYPARNERPADIYSLGAMAFELFTGTRLPADEETMLRCMLGARLDSELAALLFWALDSVPERRPSAAELAEALRELTREIEPIAGPMRAVA